MRRLLACLTLLACQASAPAVPAPPPAPALAACSDVGVQTHEGYFSLIYGDPPSGGPRMVYTLTVANQPTLTLLIGDELLQAHEAGRALNGRRVVITGTAVVNQSHTWRVCTIEAR